MARSTSIAEDAQSRTLTTMALLLTVIVSACGAPPDPADDTMDDMSDTEQVTEMSAAPPATSINAIMVGLVDHAAHHIWDLGRDGMAPETDRDWDEVNHAAIQLIAAETAITAGGQGEMDQGWVQEPGWRDWASGMSDAGAMALEAANARDLDAVLSAGDALIETCEGCHTDYKPALPTEGIVHPHYYDE